MKAGLFACILASSLSLSVAGASEPGPVTRVVELLEQLQARLESDGSSEQEAYDKFACWCETATSKKAGDITSLRDKLQNLGNTILELKGTVATTVAELEQLAKDIRENEEAQHTMTSIRSKENAAFEAEKVELQQAISALQGAIHVLRGATSAASLRQSKSSITHGEWSSVLSKVRSAVKHLPSHAKPSANHLLALSKVGDTYTPQSTTIQGILQDMYDSFTSTLEQETSSEATQHRNFEDLMATYQTELAAMQESITKKERQKAEAETMMADAEDGFGAGEEQLKVDIEYFDATKASCVAKTDEWSARKTLRREELQGISEALTILTSEEAKDLFAKSIKPGVGGAAASFLQVASAGGAASAAKHAQEGLQAVARQTHSMRLAAIAAALGEQASAGRAVGHFEKVFVAIDNLINQLAADQADDESRVKSCTDQFHEIDSAVADLDWKMENNNAALDKLGRLIEAKGKEKDALIEEMTKTGADIKSMEAERTGENGEFTQAKTDDQKAIELLEKAVTALQAYYAKNGVELGPLEGGRAALVQKTRDDEPDEPAPEAKFSDKGKSKGESKGIIAILKTIIEDLETEISDGKKAEESAQLSYEERHGIAEKLLGEMNETKINLESFVAQRKQDQDDEQTKLDGNTAEKKGHTDTLVGIKPSCTFITSNLEDRTRKRDAEREGLKTAKDYLAGMSESASASFLQLRRKH